MKPLVNLYFQPSTLMGAGILRFSTFHPVFRLRRNRQTLCHRIKPCVMFTSTFVVLRFGYLMVRTNLGRIGLSIRSEEGTQQLPAEAFQTPASTFCSSSFSCYRSGAESGTPLPAASPSGFQRYVRRRAANRGIAILPQCLYPSKVA